MSVLRAVLRLMSVRLVRTSELPLFTSGPALAASIDDEHRVAAERRMADEQRAGAALERERALAAIRELLALERVPPQPPHGQPLGEVAALPIRPTSLPRP